MATVVSTWTFGIEAVKLAKRVLCEGQSALDTVEEAVSTVEDDPVLGVYFVGRGGCPNSEGQLECDAALMDGNGLRFGAVAAIKGIGTPIHVARRVMDKSSHSMLVGQGAQDFAVREGFGIESSEALGSDKAQQMYMDSLKKQKPQDTIGLIARDKHGNLAVGVSTSGIALKAPGRVGDSPLPGPGLYADNDIGAACATGEGDQILRFCPSYRVVMLMEEGLHPKDACQRVIRYIASKVGPKMFEMGIIAMNKQGQVGSAGSLHDWEDNRTSQHYPGFPCVVWSEVDQPEPIVHTEPSALLSMDKTS